VGLAYLLEYLDYTIKTPEELDEAYGISTLGVIGNIKGINRARTPAELLVAVTQPRSLVSEAFRALVTNIRFAIPGTPVRSLLITSAGPLEGKTLTSANLAAILAQGGRSVILVDTDLRRPRLHRLFEVAREPGFTDLVVFDGASSGGQGPEGMEAHVHDIGMHNYLQPTLVPGLRLLASGTLPHNPAELLGSNRTVEVMSWLKDQADIVVYDSPPAATVTDAAVLSSRVDAVVHVVKAGGPRRDIVVRVRAVLEKVGARVLGPVLNQVSLSDLGYYSSYYYGYYPDHESSRKRSTRRPRRRPRRRRRRKPEAGFEDEPASAPPGEGTADGQE
ncbi:CpsD/CapB family tyrosine-protein kinase, partial [Chloroflexota bacterium]